MAVSFRGNACCSQQAVFLPLLQVKYRPGTKPLRNQRTFAAARHTSKMLCRTIFLPLKKFDEYVTSACIS
jgi:hypothetical protein